MTEITTIGLDLAKHTFHVVGCNRHGKEVKRRMLKRAQVMGYFANLRRPDFDESTLTPISTPGADSCAEKRFRSR